MKVKTSAFHDDWYGFTEEELQTILRGGVVKHSALNFVLVGEPWRRHYRNYRQRLCAFIRRHKRETHQ